MSEAFSADVIVKEIFLLNKIEMAREQVTKGEFLYEDELEHEINLWE